MQLKPIDQQVVVLLGASSGIGRATALRFAERGAKSVTTIMPPGVNTPLFNKARTKIGVKPMHAPPIYSPEVIADAIVRAAEYPTRDVAVTAFGKALVGSQRLSPQLTDALVQATGFNGQKTNEPKSAAAPDNLYQSVQGFDRIDGDFSGQAIGRGHRQRPRSNGDMLGAAVLGAALGGALLLVRQRNQHKSGDEGESTIR